MFCYHIGLVYALLKLHYTNVIYDRDFDTFLHTGKRYIDYLDDWEPYELYAPLDELKTIKKFQQLTATPIASSIHLPTKYPSIYKELITELQYKQQEQLKGIEKIIEEYKRQNKKVPYELLAIKNKTETYIERIEQIEMQTLLSYIYNYIARKYEKENVIKEIIKYIIADFLPANELDFPLGDIKRRKELTKLVEQTKYLEKGDTRKWTTERIKEYEETEDPYIKYVIMNDTLYTWYKYIVPKVIVPKEKQIRSAYLLYELLGKYTRFLSSKVIIFSKLSWYELLRLRKVFKWVKKGIEKEAGLSLMGFVTEEMLKNQGCVTKEFNKKEYMAFASENSFNMLFTTKPEKFMEIMVEKGWVKVVKILKG